MADAISVDATVRVSPAQLWTALTDPVERAQWWAGMMFAASPGGALEERWTEDGVEYTAEGTVREVVPNQLLQFTWSEATWETPTTVTIALRPTDSGTQVQITEQGLARLAAGQQVAREHEAGWQWHLDQLRKHAESQ